MKRKTRSLDIDMDLAPKKPKVILNPEWEGSEEQIEEAHAMSSDLRTYYSLVPSECHCKIPPEGAWVMVKNPPFTEWTVPPLSMWYAMEEVKPHARMGQTYHFARILTPKGDLWLYPDEYVVVKDVSVYFEFPDDHVHINLLGGQGGIDPNKLFYIRSRGISKKDAIKMLLGEVKAQDVAYITVHPEYGKLFCRSLPKQERLCVQEQWAA